MLEDRARRYTFSDFGDLLIGRRRPGNVQVLPDRATEEEALLRNDESGVVAAGCDVALHCSGKMEEMVAVAAAVPAMSADGEARLARAMATVLVADEGADFAEAVAKRDALLALV